MPRRALPQAEPPLKRDLLTATRRIFAELGYDAISMRKVAAEVGCTATAIYLYFKDKDALMESMVVEDFLEIAAEFEELRDDADPVERLRKFCFKFFGWAQQNPHHYRFLFMTPRPPLDPNAAQERNRPETNAYLMAKEAAQEAFEAGRIHVRFMDGDALIQTLLAGVHGVIALHLSNFNDPWIPWKPWEHRAQLMIDSLFESVLKA